MNWFDCAIRNQQHFSIEKSREKLLKNICVSHRFCMWAQKKPSKETLVIIIRKMSHTITFVWAAAKSITRLPSQRLFPTAKRWAKCIIRALFYMARKCSFPPLVSKNCFAQQFSSHQRNTHRWNLFQLICNLHGLVSKFKTFTKFCSRAAISGNDWIFSDTLSSFGGLPKKPFCVLKSFTRLFFTSLDPILWFCQKYFAFPCLYWRSALACNIAIWWNPTNWRWKRLDEWFYFPIVVFIIPLPFTCVKKYT